MANNILLNKQFSYVAKAQQNQTNQLALNSFIAQLNRSKNIIENNFVSICNGFNLFVLDKYKKSDYLIGMEHEDTNSITYHGNVTETDKNLELERRITYIEMRIKALQNSFEGWVPANVYFYISNISYGGPYVDDIKMYTTVGKAYASIGVVLMYGYRDVGGGTEYRVVCSPHPVKYIDYVDSFNVKDIKFDNFYVLPGSYQDTLIDSYTQHGRLKNSRFKWQDRDTLTCRISAIIWGEKNGE